MDIPRTETSLCECGCGNLARPGNRFIHGHNHQFQALTDNPRWMGDDAGRSAMHKWLHKIQPLTGTCQECGAHPPVRGSEGTHYAFQYHGQKPYTRDLADYRELCSPCHLAFDAELLTQSGRDAVNKRWAARDDKSRL